MADIPTPRSYPQTLGDMFDAFLSKQGIRSLRVGGPIVSILEAAAQSDMRNAQDIFNLLTSADLDNATGLALSRIGRNEGVPKLEITPASGIVTVSDSSFTKKATRLFQGAPAPIVGTGVVTPLNVVDASDFPAPGADTRIYIGRGTNNYEGPILYTGLVDAGNHWEITLATPTTKFHNTSETVILAQGGNRIVGPNSTVRTPQASVASAVEFRTLYPVTLPDGETSVANIQVVSQLGGLIGNVIAGAVSEFSSSPFSGAVVTNPLPFTNGRETESDDDYRERIRAVRASRQLATTLAITTAVTGITAFDENKRINSASLVKRFGFPATLYIDDGTGYEERTAAIAIESLMDDAVGGETHFETTQRPIARAFAISNNVAPFVLRASDKLSVKVGGVTYTHSFDAAAFHSITNASAFEVVASINSNPDIAFIARTAEQGSKVVIFANADVNEDIEVVDNTAGTNANDGLQFPAGVNYTMRLYKNDRLLTKDGVAASIQSLPFTAWDSVSGSPTLLVAVDGTPAITYSFTGQDFIDANTGYATMGRNSLDAWASVINAKIPGVTARVSAGRLVLTSNAGPVAKAAVEITGGDLVTAHFFPLDSVHGQPRDYVLDRNEAQIVLMQVLEAGDRLTAGSFATRAFIESDDMETINLASDAHLWWLVDGSAQIVQHGVISTTSLDIDVSKSEDFGNILSITALSAVWENVQSQDWMVLWDANIPASLRGVHRVASVDGNSVQIERHSASVTMRYGHQSVSLTGTGANAGLVLTCGGNIKARSGTNFTGSLLAGGTVATAELYDHNTKTVTPAAPMNHSRMFHSATKLANGKVVVVGGVDDAGTALKTIETYDPALDTWTNSAVQLTTGRKDHTATLLTDGRILIAGGDDGGVALISYQIYSPSGDTINAAQNMTVARTRHRAVKLTDDNVLIVGGYNTVPTVLASAELFTPGVDTTAATGSMTGARAGFGLALVGTSPTNVIAVGNTEFADEDTWELYSIAGGTWSTYTTSTNLKYGVKEAITLTNGHVVGLAGYSGVAVGSSMGFTYDGVTFTQITSQAPYVTDLGGPLFDPRMVEIKSGDGTTIKNIVALIGGSFEHGSSFLQQPTSVFNTYVEPTDTWDAPDPADSTAITLNDVGIAFVRSNAFVQATTVPTGSNYTASSLADVFNDALFGATASVYKTTKLRVATNTFDATGDIALVTQDVAAEALLIEAGDAISNLVPHLGSVMSRNSDLGTPSFEDVRVVSQEPGTGHTKPVITSVVVEEDYALVGLKNLTRGGNGSSTYHPTAWVQERANSNYKFATRLKTRSNDTVLVSTVETTDAPVQPWGPWDRVMAASPFAISPNGTLDILVDNDNNKRYPINLWRVLNTVGNTYSSTNAFKDGSSSGLSLSETFGIDYDFNDMAVYMAARARAFGSDAARRMLFRFFRLGPDGNGAQVRFGNPDAESSDMTVETEQLNGHFSSTIKLKSGALRTPTVHNTTRVGRAITNVTAGGTSTFVQVLNLPISSAVRTSNVTTVTVTLPAGVTDHGIDITSRVWVESTDPNFSSGLKTITGVTTTTLDYAETAADQGATANIGTLSFDSQGEATYTGSSVAAKDFLRVVDPTFLIFLGNVTMQVATVPAGGHYITTLSGDQHDGSSDVVTTALVWAPINAAENFKLFANSPQTAGAIATAIQALRDADGSICPIGAKELGTGANDIDQNSCDENDDSLFWYTLADGINWVKTTNSPVSPPTDYTLEFKAPITTDLASNSDWENEVVRLVPITTKNIVDWLNTPTVTGLWSVADIEEAGEGHHVEISTLTAGSAGGIDIQGGLANGVTAPVVGTPIIWPGFSGNTVALHDTDGLHTGMWCRIENENPQPKTGGTFGSGLALQSWSTDGLLTFNLFIAVQEVIPTEVRCQFEKQGNFIAVSDIGAMTNPFGFSAVTPGMWLRISPATSLTPSPQDVSAANQGLFRVLRYVTSVNGNGGTIWIENASGIEETSECTLEVYTAASVMPGDQLVVLDDSWGAGNIGVWDIKAVGETTPGSGDVFTQLAQFTVDVTSRRPIPQSVRPALDSSGVVYIREGTPRIYVMRIDGLSLNQDDGTFADIRWDQIVTGASISAASGSIIQVLDKLEFPPDFASGADGYRYDIGLLREANKVVYGDPADPATYPGVAAADAHINIQGPIVKRIQVGLSVRVKSGLNTQDIANRVRSAVATVVNQTPIGKSISFSDIIDAAREVVGVVSVAIVSPLFSVDHDQIKVQPYEKPFVLDLTQDVQVSFLGT